jgi:hypothetical protein
MRALTNLLGSLGSKKKQHKKRRAKQRSYRNRFSFRPQVQPLEARQLMSINQPPVLEVSDQQATEGGTLIFRASATDPDPGNGVTYSLEWNGDSPANDLFWSDQTGLFVWAPGEDDGGKTYSATITASDGSLSDEETIDIVVNEGNLRPSFPSHYRPTSYHEVTFQGGATQEPITFGLKADDADAPTQSLSFSAGPVGTKNVIPREMIAVI